MTTMAWLPASTRRDIYITGRGGITVFVYSDAGVGRAEVDTHHRALDGAFTLMSIESGSVLRQGEDGEEADAGEHRGTHCL